MKRKDDERRLTKIPLLGPFFKFIKENRKCIEKTLDRGEETKGKVKQKSLLDGILTVVSQKTFNLLKKDEKRKRR